MWIAQQKISGSQRLLYDLPEPADPSEVCWLVDWKGKLLKTGQIFRIDILPG